MGLLEERQQGAKVEKGPELYYVQCDSYMCYVYLYSKILVTLREYY